MDEVEGTKRAGDLNEVHRARGADEDGDIVNLGAVEVQPEVGDGVVGACAAGWRGVGIDEVLPSGDVIDADDGGHDFRGVEGGLGIAIGIHRDAVDCGGGAAGWDRRCR